MLIKSEEEQKKSGITRHQKCSYCNEELFQPRIVINDAQHSSYHPQCAVRVMGYIAFDMQDFLNSPDLAKMADSIHAQAKLKEIRRARSLDPADEAFWDEHWDEQE